MSKKQTNETILYYYLLSAPTPPPSRPRHSIFVPRCHRGREVQHGEAGVHVFAMRSQSRCPIRFSENSDEQLNINQSRCMHFWTKTFILSFISIARSYLEKANCIKSSCLGRDRLKHPNGVFSVLSLEHWLALMGRDRLKHPNGVFNVLSLTALVTSTEICKTDKGVKLKQFNNITQDMLFPCKYWALREQKCGKYKINLSPGHRWLYPKYFLDTLWLGVLDTNTIYVCVCV